MSRYFIHLVPLVCGIASFISVSDLSLLIYRNERNFSILLLYLASFCIPELAR